MKFKLKLFASLAACAALAVLAGCSSPTTNVAGHVIQGAGKVIKFGIVQDPATGQYSLGYESGFLGFMYIPLVTVTNSAGVVSVLIPDAVMSYEIGGKGGFFGSAASTVTFATGSNGVNSILGGNHPPINLGYWTNSATGVSAAIPVATNAVQGATIKP